MYLELSASVTTEIELLSYCLHKVVKSTCLRCNKQSVNDSIIVS